jgi:hypothetical protein
MEFELESVVSTYIYPLDGILDAQERGFVLRN